MTDAENLSNYHRIVAIVEDQISLQHHIEAKRPRYQDIEFSQVDAYLKIVDILIESNPLNFFGRPA